MIMRLCNNACMTSGLMGYHNCLVVFQAFSTISYHHSFKHTSTKHPFSLSGVPLVRWLSVCPSNGYVTSYL